MKKLSRREFIYQSASGLAATSALTSFGTVQAKNSFSAMAEPLGFQSWTIRDVLVKDFAGTLKLMAGMGYQRIEMCSPPGYANYGFGPLQNMKAAEMKRIMTDAGISCISCHYGFNELKENIEDRIDFALELGLTQMVIASPGLPDKATLGDYKKAAGQMNSLAESCRKSDIQLVYHNHNFEFEKLEGELIYDVLLQYLDPALVKMQFQVWVIIAGYKAADYFRKYPGRFISAHLSDWSGKAEEQVAIGKGKVDWKDFFEAGKVGGLKNFFVEMDMPVLKDSAAYLKKLS